MFSLYHEAQPSSIVAPEADSQECLLKKYPGYILTIGGKVMKTIWRELSPFKTRIFLVFILVVGSSMANLALPMYLSDVINLAIPKGDRWAVMLIGGKMLIFVLIGLFCSIAMGFLAAKISMGLGKNLRSKVFQKVQYFSQAEFDRFSTSSLITRTNNDVLQVQTFTNMMLRISLLAPIMAVGGIVMALQKSATMSMILLISMPLLLGFVFAVAKRVMPLSQKMQEKLDLINLVMREKLTGVRVARVFGTEDFEETRFDRVNRDFMENSVKMNRMMAMMMPGLNLILYGTTLALIGFGGRQIISGTSIPIGDVIAVVQYVMQIMMSVVMLSMVFIVYPRAAVSSGRIEEVLCTKPRIENIEDPITQTAKHGYVSFRNVSFTFPKAAEPVLQDISFDSAPGEITAIIGSTGCGKSTLVSLIPRFYDVEKGEILVDGVNVKSLDLTFLRSKIGWVPQKAFLFQGSVSKNIRYGDERITESEVEHAIRVAQSYDFVMEKEEGLNTVLSQGGSNVSGGQRQRLAIARAVAKKPEIYIFDDSFSALDFKTDAALRKALAEEAKESTVILVAQRVSTIKNADRIIVLENGRIVGQGTHRELLKVCKVYQEIVNSQRSEEEVEE